MRGTSMRPALADGDVVTLAAPRADEHPRPGEVVTFLDEHGNPVTHRLLGVEPAAGGATLVTQGDGRSEPDAPWPEERLVGTVTAAERPPARLPRRLLALERLAWWEAAERLATRLRALPLVRRLQRRVAAPPIELGEERHGPVSGEWLAITCTVRGARGAAAGWVTVLQRGADADASPLWLLFGLQVRLRHRGLGLGRRLLAAAEAAVARAGGGRMYAFVRPDNRPSVRLFASCGWRAGSAPAGTVCAPELASYLCFLKER